MIWNNVKAILVHLSLSIMGFMMLTFMSRFSSMNLAAGMIPGIGQWVNAGSGLEKAFGWLVIAMYVLNGFLMRPQRSLLRTVFSIISIAILLLVVMLLSRWTDLGIVTTIIQAPLYLMMRMTGESHAPLWFATMPYAFLLMGLLGRWGIGKVFSLMINWTARKMAGV